MKKQRRVFLLFCALAGLLLLKSGACRAGAREGLAVCGEVLLPSLFPMSVLCALWTGSGNAAYCAAAFGGCMRKLFRLPGQAAIPLAVGLIGGYPLGSHALAGTFHRGDLDREDAAALSAFCNNPGPAFLIGAVGISLFQSAAVGAWIWAISAASSLLTGILLAKPGSRNVEVPRKSEFERTSFLSSFPGALQAGVNAMLRVCGTVVLFFGLQAAFQALLAGARLPEWIRVLITGTAELTTGVLSTAALEAPVRFLLCTGFASWGGFCVHAQAAEALTREGLPLRPYLRGKLMQTGLSLAFAAALCPWLFPHSAFELPNGRLILPVLGLCTGFPLIFKKYRWKKQKNML